MTDNVEIRVAARDELPVLEAHLGKREMPWFHARKLEDQERGDGLWLVAWKDGIPVGHLQVRWVGADQAIQKHIKDCPHLESACVVERLQSQGIGTRLIAEAERLAKSRGYRTIGIAVGSTDNPRARRLYEQLRYNDWGYGEFVITWEYIDQRGNLGTESEVCIYLLKTL